MPAQANSKKGETWDAFEIADLIARREASNRPYLQFLKVPTLSAGLYVLPAGAEDRQPVHDEDEIYYIVSGRATIKVGDEDRAVQPGSIVFVKAGIEHRFHSIKEELKVVVFFSSAKPS
ncbi:MAG: cupin domain-containing protein [Blastocatellia bacterium]|nr:cupin domain-containing protein [Blastocatellia bacterium]